MNLKEAISRYSALYLTGSSNTCRTRRIALKPWFEKLEQTPQISSELVRSFLNTRERLGESPATIGARFAAICHFCKFIEKAYPGFVSPTSDIRTPTVLPGLPKKVPEEQLRTILESLNCEDYRECRALVLIHLLCGCGLRIDEARRLTVEQIDLKRNLIVGLIGKGNFSQLIPIPDRALAAIVPFLSLREKFLGDEIPGYQELPDRVKSRYPLLVSIYNSQSKDLYLQDQWRISPKGLWHIVAAIGQASGAHVHPHQFRHSFGDQLMKSTKNPRLVAKALRHRSLSTVMRYTELTEEDVRMAVNNIKL